MRKQLNGRVLKSLNPKWLGENFAFCFGPGQVRSEISIPFLARLGCARAEIPAHADL